MVVLCDGTAQFGVGVLHAVTFVDDHVQPLDFTQDRSVLDDKLVRGEENLELPAADLLRVVLTLVRRSLVHDARDRWRPLFELVVPVRQGTERHDDQEGARLLLLLNEVRDERDSLDSFAETHLVGKNTVQVVVVERNHPLKTLELVILERATNQVGRLCRDFLFNTVSNLVVIDLAFRLLVAAVASFLGIAIIVEFVSGVQMAALLRFHGSCQLAQEAVSLLQQVRDTAVLGLSKKPEVGLLVVSLQSLETLLSCTLNALLLFLFDVRVRHHHGTAQLALTLT